MKKQILEQYIRQIVREYIAEQRLKNIVKQMVFEQVNKSGGGYLTEINAGGKRRAVMKMLRDEKYDHAYLAYKLWHPKDQSEKDTYRSLFSKKFTGKPDADGTVRQFTTKEINRLYSILTKM